jgi:hypothetical protein
MAAPMTVTVTQSGGLPANGTFLNVTVLLDAADASLQAGATATALIAGLTAPQTSITTTVTGSVVYGHLHRAASSNAFAANASTTLDDNVQDTANGKYWGTCRTTAATGTPGAVTVGSTGTAGAALSEIALAEILANGTITEDASSPATVLAATAQSATSASFTPPDGALLVAIIGANNASNTATATVTGGGYTWTPLIELGHTGTQVYSAVWIAQVPASAPPSTSFLVTANQGGSTANGVSLRVRVLTGAADLSVQSGATASADAVQQVAVTTTETGSLVYGAVMTSGALTANGVTTLTDDYNDGSSGFYGAFRTTAVTGTPGSVTAGCTFIFSGGGVAAAEVLPYGTTALAEDASGPPLASTNASASVSTALFSPPAGSLLVAMAGANGGAGVCTMTVLGGGLTWTEVIAANASGHDYAGVWMAQVPQQLSAPSSGFEPGWFPG